ncbi:MAG: TolB family protein [Gemmatimonadales bacterium]
MRQSLALAIALVSGPAALAAQAPPGTEVYLAPLTARGGRPVIGTAVNLTNRAGYDNQPSFTPDGRGLYYTVIGADGHADVRRIDLASGRSSPFITTDPESEYSPTPMPDGREVAVIRVEADSSQRLWAFPVAGGEPRLLLERVEPVGYQAWLDRGRVGVFVLGSPATLQLADLHTGEATILLSSIGRALQKVPGKDLLSVTHQIAADRWYLTLVDPESRAVDHLIAMPPGADYYAWLPDGSALTASGAAFYHFRPGRDAEWVSLGAVAGVRGISRIAVSPNGRQVAFVGNEGGN